MCIAQMPAPLFRATWIMSGSPSSPVTSLMISAPRSRARAATTAFEVSIDTGTPVSATSRRTTSATRRGGHGLREWPRALAADVENVGPFAHKLQSMRDGGLDVGMTSAV